MHPPARTQLGRSIRAMRTHGLSSLPGACAPRATIAVLALLALAGIAQGAVTAYETFDYATSIPDATPTTASGFTGNWTCGTVPSVVAGMNYTGLPTANGSLSSTSGRQSESFLAPLSSGTKWISFLFTQVGNNGANICGVYFPNGGTGLFFGYGLAPYSGTQGGLGLGSMTTTGSSPQGAVNLASSFLGTYGTTYLVALRIDFNTSGANDTITVYINPTAGSSNPSVAPTYTLTTFDVGTLTGIGFQNQGGGLAVKADEIRVGDTYGDVVGHVGVPPGAPGGLAATPGTNRISLSWTAATGGPTGYNVKRSSFPGGPYDVMGSTTAPTVIYEDSVLGGETYYYVVTAVNGAGESTNSLEVSATPTLGPPDAPAGLIAPAGNAQVALSWQPTPFATSYNLKRATAFAGPYSPIGATTVPTVAYTDSSGLVNGMTYYYVVSATGAGGTGPDSAPVSATPVGPVPLELAIARGKGIAWFASNDVTYQVQWTAALEGTNTVWNDLGGPIAGEGATNTVFDPAGPSHSAYRVLSIE